MPISQFPTFNRGMALSSQKFWRCQWWNVNCLVSFSTLFLWKCIGAFQLKILYKHYSLDCFKRKRINHSIHQNVHKYDESLHWLATLRILIWPLIYYDFDTSFDARWMESSIISCGFVKQLDINSATEVASWSFSNLTVMPSLEKMVRQIFKSKLHELIGLGTKYETSWHQSY